MRIFRGYPTANHHYPLLKTPSAWTIGNFDGVHRGHQAMLALLKNEAQHRGLPTGVITFEPHPRDFFAATTGKAELAPARIATLRDKLLEIAQCGVDQTVILPFNAHLASMPAEDFVHQVLFQGLGARYCLVGDDFRFGAKRVGNYELLDQMGCDLGMDVARMQSYEIHGERISSSLVRASLQAGDMQRAASLLGRNYTLSGHVVYGRRLGRELGFPTLNMRFSHWKPAAGGIFIVRVHGLGEKPLAGVANMGVRPSLDATDVNGGRVLLETHCLDWPAHLGSEGAYGKILHIELLHKLHDELKYDGLDALRAGIDSDVQAARAYFKNLQN